MITQSRRSAIYALVAYTLLLVDGEDEGGDEVKETDDDDEGEPSESDEGVTSDGEVTWGLHELEEDDTSEELTHQIGEDVSHEGSDPVDDGPLEDEQNPAVTGKHIIMCYNIVEGDAGTLEVTPEDDDEWNRQAQHDAETDTNPRHVPTKEDDDE